MGYERDKSSVTDIVEAHWLLRRNDYDSSFTKVGVTEIWEGSTLWLVSFNLDIASSRPVFLDQHLYSPVPTLHFNSQYIPRPFAYHPFA